MPIWLLVLLAGSAAVVVRNRAVAAAQTGGKSAPPQGVVVVCPSRLPGVPSYAPPHTAYGDWSTPCDVQEVANTPPIPWAGSFDNCGSAKDPGPCRVLPDGTPLYEYEPSGLTAKTANLAKADNAPPVTQTYFAGVPLDWPPLLNTGMPAYSFIPTPGLNVAAGIGSTLYKSSPAPYAWWSGSDAYGRSKLSPADVYKSQISQIYACQNAINPYPDNVAAPERLIPAPKPESLAIGGVINSLRTFACNALGRGLSVAAPARDIIGDKPVKLATNFYKKACGD